MLFVNGRVFLGTGEQEFAGAFRVREGRFDWVGDTPPRPAADEEVVDLGGATVLPGLLDIHTHPALLGELVDTVSVLPPAVTSIEEMVETLRAGAEPDSSWVRGFGFDDAKYPEGRWPNRHDMDRVSESRPVIVQRCDGHSAVCNTAALRLAGITSETPDPPGAQFGRDDAGEPDGRLIEPAAWRPVMELAPPVSDEQRITRLARLGEHFARRGLVGVADLAATLTADPLPSFRAAADRAWLPRTGLYLLWPDICDDPPVLTDSDRSGEVFVAGVKVLMDGAYSNATAWCHDAYPGGGHGIRTTTREELRGAADWARANGVQLAAHAMGDAAIDAVLDEFEHEPGWLGELPAVRIEHSTLFSPERIARVKAATMPFAVVSHSVFFFAEYEAYAQNLSASQFAHAYPLRSFAEELSFTALASDSPATAWSEADDVFVSVKAAVTRRAWNGADLGAEQALTVPQALLLYTSRAAACMGLDGPGGLGSIQVGNDASFVVLDRDVFATPPEQLDTVGIAQTWSGGVRRYASGQG